MGEQGATQGGGFDSPDYEARAKTVEAELHAAGVLGPGEVEQRAASAPVASKFLEGRRVVARAWVDLDFRQRLLSDGTSAIAELGLQVEASHQPGLQLCAVENTDEVHNLIVCTLCSCYPRALLGAPPAWYASEAYRAKAVRDPVGVLADFGVHLDPDVRVQVWDSTAQTRYLVVPQRPAGTGGWDEERLSELITPEALIGTAVIQEPATT